MDNLLVAFIEEGREHLEQLEALLLQLEQGTQSAEVLDAIFRAAHTLKGASGVAEIESIEAFTHVLESLLEQVRAGDLSTSSRLVSLLLQSCDFLSELLALVEATGGSPALTEDQQARSRSLQEALRSCAADSKPTQNTGVMPTMPEQSGPNETLWQLSIRFDPHLMKQGIDPASCLKYLLALGNIESLETLTDQIPQLDAMDPEISYLGFELTLRTDKTESEIASAFTFVEEGSCIAIRRCDAPLEPPVATEQRAPEPAQQRVTAPAPEASASRMIRVPADKLDRLIDLIGELVIAGSSIQLLSRQTGHAALLESNEIMARLIEDVRDSALQMRMVTIGETFNRFQRVVRDTANELNKQIELQIFGADTELDKSVVERLSDPLLHLVRNALDHGIETAEERRAAGKTLPALVKLNAFHDSGNVVIEISDDGRGLNRDKILAKALQSKLISPDHSLSDSEIFQLIFEPGFSTADQVTSLSGRGVGMDVVKRTINSLRGTIDVQSSADRGSKFTLRLPLTLAIIDGFQVSLGDHNYVIPLDNVVECLEFDANTLFGEVLQLRGAALPIVRLRDLFSIDGEPPRRENVVVVQAANARVGIVVDQLQGEIQTVIKPLGQLFKHLRGVAGSTILGSGEVALILDVSNLVSVAASHQHRTFEHSINS